MGDGFIENVFCGRIIEQRESKTTDLTVATATITMKVKELATKTTECDSAKAQLAQAQEALNASSQQNKQTISDLQQQIASQQASINSQAAVIEALHVQASAQTDFMMLPAEVRTILLAYDGKYAEAEVIYTGRTLPNIPTKPFSMRVQDWAQAGIGIPEAVACVKAAKAYPLDIMKEKNCSFHRACDIGVLRMKVWVTNFIPYKYQYDDATTGVNEFWKFFIELYYSMQRYGIGDDCDGWAVFMYILWRTAGIPRELLRIIGCTTRGSGEGHATNGYFASDCKWHHINSTTPYGMPDLTGLEMPLLNDPKDSMGPGATWFSFDEKKSWSGDAGTKAQAFAAWNGERGKKLPKMLRNVTVKLLLENKKRKEMV